MSERGAQARMVEMSRQVLTSLDRMISEAQKTVTEDTKTTPLLPLTVRLSSGDSGNTKVFGEDG